jgi:hypothetical protein
VFTSTSFIQKPYDVVLDVEPVALRRQQKRLREGFWFFILEIVIAVIHRPRLFAHASPCYRDDHRAVKRIQRIDSFNDAFSSLRRDLL